MTAVNNSLIQKYFQKQIQSLADNISNNKSTVIISPKMQTSFLVRYFSENVELKRQLFGRYFDDYVFVCLPSRFEWAFETFEQDLLQSILASLPDIDVPDFQQLYEALVRDEKYVVISSDADDREFYKNLYSYRYFLGTRVLFILSSSNDLVMSNEFGRIEIQSSIEQLIIQERLLEVDIQLSEDEVTEIISKVNGDIGHIDEVIMRWLYERTLKQSFAEKLVQTNIVIEDVTPIEEPIEVVSSATEEPEPEMVQGPFDTFSSTSPNVQESVFVYEPEAFSQATLERYAAQQGDFKEESIDSLESQNEPDVKSGPEVIPQIAEKITSAIKKTTAKPQTASTTNAVGLTEREQMIYDALLQKKFLSRDEFAEIVWGEDAKSKANPDAIDQIISRLRRKFVKAGYDKKYITSKKGEGILINET